MFDDAPGAAAAAADREDAEDAEDEEDEEDDDDDEDEGEVVGVTVVAVVPDEADVPEADDVVGDDVDGDDSDDGDEDAAVVEVDDEAAAVVDAWEWAATNAVSPAAAARLATPVTMRARYAGWGRRGGTLGWWDDDGIPLSSRRDLRGALDGAAMLPGLRRRQAQG